jgi:hypothetical protein
MPKVEEFYHIYNKRLSATRRTRRASACAAGARALRERLRCASETIILGILDHLVL